MEKIYSAKALEAAKTQKTVVTNLRRPALKKLLPRTVEKNCINTSRIAHAQKI